MALWTMFSVWLIAHCARLPARIGRVALGLLWLELGLLAVWSYGSEGCDVPDLRTARPGRGHRRAHRRPDPRRGVPHLPRGLADAFRARARIR